MFPIRMNSDWRDAAPQLFAEKSQARVPLQAFTVRWDTAHRAPGHWSPGATRRGLRREAPPWGRSRADAHLRMAWNLCTRSL